MNDVFCLLDTARHCELLQSHNHRNYYYHYHVLRNYYSS